MHDQLTFASWLDSDVRSTAEAISWVEEQFELSYSKSGSGAEVRPWGGQILAATVASLTLPIYGTWQSQYVISSALSMLVALIAFFGLRELGPGLRGQVLITADDAAGIEEQAARFDAAAMRHPWRQMLRWSILLSALGYGLYNVPRYTINVFLPTYLNGALAVPLAQANRIASIFGVAFIGGSLVIGFASDRFQVS
jgi:sugar phosphate permease